jgi:hypothetical protein
MPTKGRSYPFGEKVNITRKYKRDVSANGVAQKCNTRK